VAAVDRVLRQGNLHCTRRARAGQRAFSARASTSHARIRERARPRVYTRVRTGRRKIMHEDFARPRLAPEYSRVAGNLFVRRERGRGSPGRSGGSTLARDAGSEEESAGCWSGIRMIRSDRRDRN
jgi:hypothetical protein